jgi:ribose transport system substrate-binding protein
MYSLQWFTFDEVSNDASPRQWSPAPKASLAANQQEENVIRNRIWAAGVGLVVVATALTACSQAEVQTSTTTSALTPAASKALANSYKGVGTSLTLDPISNIPSNVNAYVISCGEAIAGCSVPTAAVKAAAGKLGWKATVADGKLNPEGFGTAIRQAIAGGAKVIIPVGIDCSFAAAAFQEAAAAGIKIVGGGGVDDCSPAVWTSQVKWLDGYTPVTEWNKFGAIQADYAFGKQNGKVKAVVINFTGAAFGPWLTDGFKAEIAKLGAKDAVVQTVDVSNAEAVDGSFVQKITTALLNHPEVNTLIVPNDNLIEGGLGAAIVQSGNANLLVVSRGGDAAVIDMIRGGGQGVNATVGYAVDWLGWGAVDTAARALAGQDAAWIGNSAQLIDAKHNLPASGSYQGALDYQKVFLHAWGK